MLRCSFATSQVLELDLGRRAVVAERLDLDRPARGPLAEPLHDALDRLVAERVDLGLARCVLGGELALELVGLALARRARGLAGGDLLDLVGVDLAVSLDLRGD